MTGRTQHTLRSTAAATCLVVPQGLGAPRSAPRPPTLQRNVYFRGGVVCGVRTKRGDYRFCLVAACFSLAVVSYFWRLLQHQSLLFVILGAQYEVCFLHICSYFSWKTQSKFVSSVFLNYIFLTAGANCMDLFVPRKPPTRFGYDHVKWICLTT